MNTICQENVATAMLCGFINVQYSSVGVLSLVHVTWEAIFKFIFARETAAYTLTATRF